MGPPDREPPDPAQWAIRSPKSGTLGSLAVLFPKPMDYALARRVIRVGDRAPQEWRHAQARVNQRIVEEIAALTPAGVGAAE